MSNDHSGAKDFFLHLGLIVSLYTSVIALVNLLFRIINIKFPQLDYSYYYSVGSPVSMPVATLIVFFPLFLYFSHLVYRSYEQSAEKKELKVRKWLLYITLFIAGVVFAGDLVTVIYYFLDGRELALGFLLKALTIFLVAGLVFFYYLKDMKDTLCDKARRNWAITATIMVLVAIVLGFIALGSPRTQRMIREDGQTVQTLQSIDSDIRYYVQNTGMLPAGLDDLYQSVYTYGNPNTYTNEGLSYRVVDADSFELCATFNLPSQGISSSTYEDPWFHSEGTSCFTRNVTDTPLKPRAVVEPTSF
ncbi:MAG: hypothetical protein COV34_02005 [Candidatus Zambryskibacteria bacterium CG10_big_fil_rev_8_21_14_0_10_42_12]|uniref:DUF5671 domain-containing protein n=1 Tax=Candidatus Zambryskibacteria bacterium CG10_big_fil_rev_8_21_14_0_10_42_12 TaxID=1975115 RepID=A0A2H0QVQ0_9BACT|nr:MAG: hypothetical protein COV34_02005 [Candidatus Zambryskibacteria bacterium CG10_big_fil_rev_8_21_14_0_10_42_12]